MTRERAKELAPIIAAYGEGKRIQIYSTAHDCWVDIDEESRWLDACLDRIAPESRRRPMTRDEVLNFLAERPNVLVKYSDGDLWYFPSTFVYGVDTSCYSYCLVTNGVRSEPRKFEIEEEA